MTKAAAAAVGQAMAPVLKQMAAFTKAPPPPPVPPGGPGSLADPMGSWHQSVAACAATMDNNVEFKPLPPNTKGGKPCTEMLLHQTCKAGASCPYHHVSGHICINYQTKDGCKKPRGKCKFVHEYIGPVAAKLLINHCKQKATNAGKMPAKPKPPDNKKAPAGGGTAAKAPPKGPPAAKKSSKPCRNFFNPSSPGTCVHGDSCLFSHDNPSE